MKNFGLILLGLITRFLVGVYVYKYSQPQYRTIVKTEKFKDLVKEEMHSFANAQTADEKLKAAEELYGKMMVIFMAELGLRVQASKSVAIPEPAKPENPSPIPEEVSETALPAPQAAASLTPAREAKRKGEEAKPGSFSHYKSSPMLTNIDQNSSKIMGHFEGFLTYHGGHFRERVDTISMTLNLSRERGRLEGDVLVILRDPAGFEHSRISGSGKNKTIRVNKSNSNEFYIEASPTSYFLLDVSEHPKLIGNYYRNGKFLGTVTLRKNL